MKLNSVLWGLAGSIAAIAVSIPVIKWGTFKIVPSEDLALALISRYEPEKLKQK